MDSVRGWMRHSTRLAVDRLDKLHPRGDDSAAMWEYRREKAALRYEVDVRSYVLARLDRAEMLNGSARVWWLYMSCHARLQDRRFRWVVDEQTFHRVCRKMRAERDARDQYNQGIPWEKEQV